VKTSIAHLLPVTTFFLDLLLAVVILVMILISVINTKEIAYGMFIAETVMLIHCNDKHITKTTVLYKPVGHSNIYDFVSNSNMKF